MLSIADVAERLDRSEATVKRLIRSGAIKAHRHINGRNIGVSEEALAEYQNRQWQPIGAPGDEAA